MNPHPHDRGTGRPSGDTSAADQAASELRAFVESRGIPDLSVQVLEQVARQRLRPDQGATYSGWRRLSTWLLTPRTISLRPVYGLAAAAAALSWIVLRPAPDPSSTFVPPSGHAATPAALTETPATDARVFVQFRLVQDSASDVRLAGSFSGWRPDHALHQTSPGVWTGTVALEPGVYDYLFVVDGSEWVSDPYAPSVSDGFGGVNNRLALVLPGEGAS